jgi:HAD superfamily hydrolase (TIGR01509 family)
MVCGVAAVIFDLDGLILDSETPEYLAWKQVYARYGLEFPLASWLQNLGRNDSPFDPLGPFRRGAIPGSPEAAFGLWRERRDALEREYLTPLPGVVALLDGLHARGMRAGVASSSRVSRVRALLDRLGLAARFHAVAGGDEVTFAKPAPDVYLLAARRLDTVPEACLALEDSENGVRAARAAGMRCVAVPSALTRGLDFSAADLVVPSLTELTLDMIAALGQRAYRTPAE